MSLCFKRQSLCWQLDHHKGTTFPLSHPPDTQSSSGTICQGFLPHTGHLKLLVSLLAVALGSGWHAQACAPKVTGHFHEDP